MHTINARAFTWVGRIGCIEASDLQATLGIHADFRYGLRVTSSRTGQAVEFHYTQSLRDESEGELIGWQFASSDRSLVITVYND